MEVIVRSTTMCVAREAERIKLAKKRLKGNYKAQKEFENIKAAEESPKFGSEILSGMKRISTSERKRQVPVEPL